MRELNLCLHCGATIVERNVIEMSPTPEGTFTHVPIPHSEILDRATTALTRGGLTIVNEAHGLSHGGNRYFGLLQVANGNNPDDYGQILGIRNSHDKTFPAAFALGNGVFVCDNLSFYGEVTLARKHTRYVRRDLPQVIVRAIANLAAQQQRQAARITCYKEHTLCDVEAHDVVINALDCQAIPSTKLPKVLQEWREPQHEDFRPRTMWSLFNSFTEVLKGNATQALKRTQALHGLMDSYCNLVAT